MRKPLLFALALFVFASPFLWWKMMYDHGSRQRTTNKIGTSQSFQSVDVSEDLKIAIIEKILSETDRKDHAISDDGKLYLYISESIFKALPKKVNGIDIGLIESPEAAKKLRLNYQTFTRWDQQDEFIWVTNTAYF